MLRVVPLCLALCGQGTAQENEESSSRARPAGSEEEANEPQPWFLRFAYEPSFVLPSNRFVEGNNALGQPIDRSQAFKLELGWQTDGTSDWAQRYRLPAIGVGVYGARIRDGEELGSPVAVYGWYSWPWFSIGERLEVTNDFGLGAAFGWEPFDPEDNPFNRAVSTPATFYTEWGVYLRYALTPRVDFTAGAVFHHFSNGGTGDPNAGINLLGPHLGLRYDLAPSRPRYADVRRELAPVPRAWELSVFGGSGRKSVDLGDLDDDDFDDDAYDPRRYGVGAFTADLHRVVHPMFRVGGGVELTYDGSANASAADPLAPTSSDKLSVGLFGGYEHIIGRFSIPVQLGYYAWRGREDERVPALYQKLGFKLDLNRRFFVGMTVRFFDFSRSDFFTWSVGIRFRREDPEPGAGDALVSRH